MSEAKIPEIPCYVSHKKVWALEIDAVTMLEDGSGELRIRDKGFAPIHAPAVMFSRFTPKPGDYLIQYADGYQSFSPRKAFLEGYKLDTSAKQHEGLPVAGYEPQDNYAVRKVNENKNLEESVLRQIDILQSDKSLSVDPRWLGLGKSLIEQGFMALNRAVFKPSRVVLPGDVDA